VDIIYANIKAAFYQPAEEGNHNVTIHFELKDPILLDKTKTKKTGVSKQQHTAGSSSIHVIVLASF
jgi:nucleosome binding factor SPN SPT16 subunit